MDFEKPIMEHVKHVQNQRESFNELQAQRLPAPSQF